MDARARGALLGSAVGDAFGTTNEFARLVAPPFPALAAGPQREIVGGGPFQVEPGQVTDDTQMACILAGVLRERGPSFDPAELARRYAEWAQVAFDAGVQTRRALDAFARGLAPP